MKVNNASASSSYSAYDNRAISNDSIILSLKKQKSSMTSKINQLAASDDRDNTASISRLKQKIEDTESKISQVNSVSSTTESKAYIQKSASEIEESRGPAYSVVLSRNQAIYRPLGYTMDGQVTYMMDNAM